MFSKLAIFRRSKQLSSTQRGKQSHYDKFLSEKHHAIEAGSMESNTSYFSPKSLLIDDTTSESSYAESAFPSSDAVPLTTNESDGNSSVGSLKIFGAYDGKESLITSSLSEEIDIGPSVLLPYEDAEEEFLENHESYFLHISVNNVRKDQYPKLEQQRIVYLDYATCPLYSRYQVEQHMRFLLEETGSGFNSTSDKQSLQPNTYVDSTSKHVLNLLNTTIDDYSVVFTPGLVSCYRLFGEMYRLQKGSVFLTSHDHKSLMHLVNIVAKGNAKIEAIPLRDKEFCIHGNEMHKLLRKRGWSDRGCGLLIYPAQSVLTGMCHSLNWIVSAQQYGWRVLLDVSCCLPTVGVDLSLYQPEFVIGSLYHMLGYPCGVGFLLVRRSAHSICLRRGSNQLKLVELPENGKAVRVVTEGESLNSHIFSALCFGLEHLESIGIEAIQKRVESLTAWLVKTLKSLKHKLDEKPLLQMYGSVDLNNRGSILAFNVLDSTGNILPARLVQQLAKRSNIFLDAGSLTDNDMANILHLKSDKQVVRLSLGPVSTFEDVYRLAQFLSFFRDEDYTLSEAVGYVQELENET